VDKVRVELAPFSRSSKLLNDLATSAGRNIVQDDEAGTILALPGAALVTDEPDAIAGLVAVNEEPPVVEPEPVVWQDMSDEQRAETIAGDEVEVEQIASVEPVAEAEALEQVAQAFQELAPKAKAPKAKVTKPKVVEAPTVRKYQTLGTIFFSGSPTGQLLSVFKTRESNVQKVLDYKAALQAGDCSLPEESLMTKALKEKLAALGISQD
jgi:hypothetical protein